MDDLPPIQNLRILSDPCADILLARSQVADYKKELVALTARIAVLKTSIAETERTIFSINRLPTEILVLVFLCTLWAPKRPVRATTESPWLVSQVCRHWREVALSSQKLWSFPTIWQIPIQSIPQFNLHLSRSGNAPLHPFIHGAPREVSRFLRPLIEVSDRWVTVILAFNWIPLQTHIALVKGNVGALEELQIEGIWNREGTALVHGQRLDVFANAPRLRKLSVKNVCEPVVSLVLPWHQLTHYRAIANAHEHLGVLNRCPNLVSADLIFPNVAFLISPAADAPILVHLPQLCHLHIEDAELLRVMSLPSLRDIVVQTSGPDNDALLPLLGLIRRDHPPLASISLVNSTLVPATLVYILEENAMLDTLRIQVNRGDTAAVDQLIGRLTIDAPHVGAAGCFAPNLVTLELSGRGSFDQGLFVAMIKSRRAAIQADSKCHCRVMRRIVVRTTPKKTLSRETVKDLQALAQTGLCVSVSTSFLEEGPFEPHYWATNTLVHY
ncbi:hypothetical protein B0H14DRAFT_3765369 [Mycena olivaceomarginata]|nr:hypothetical protein B0H14DRAFT_3765369 [Mycena olivaceomarginata]